jgi:hypothetical protein
MLLSVTPGVGAAVVEIAIASVKKETTLARGKIQFPPLDDSSAISLAEYSAAPALIRRDSGCARDLYGHCGRDSRRSVPSHLTKVMRRF